MHDRNSVKEEVQQKLAGYRGAQKFMNLYFKLPRFFSYVDKYPAALDSIYTLRQRLEIQKTPSMRLDDLMLHIAREWTSPLIDDETRNILDENLGSTADHLLIIASMAECKKMM